MGDISSSSAVPSLLFSGTQAEAKTEVKQLRNLLYAHFVLQKPQEYTRPAPEFLQSLLERAYPGDDSLEMQVTHQGFARYLSENPIKSYELFEHINHLHLIEVGNKAIEAGEKEGALPFANDEPEKIEGSMTSFLAKKGVTPYFSETLGEGHFGAVFKTDVHGEEDKYVFKQEKRDVGTALTSRSLSFWREGDCAAARITDISNRTRPLFFIFSVYTKNKEDDWEEELHYVPANHVKAFGMSLPARSAVYLEGQLMERAKGENLGAILKTTSTKDLFIGKHFRYILRGLFKTIQEMQAHNFLHADIKPDNVFYNEGTGEVTLLDFGLATKLRKKEKPDDGAHLHQPTSRKMRGTPKYLSPRVLSGKEHGAEVDLFSFGMIALEMINLKDFQTCDEARIPGRRQGDHRDAMLLNCKPEDYLKTFLSPLTDKSMIKRMLARNSMLEMMINLALQASGGGAAGAEAYEQLKALPLFKKRQKDEG